MKKIFKKFIKILNLFQMKNLFKNLIVNMINQIKNKKMFKCLRSIMDRLQKSVRLTHSQLKLL